MQNDTTKKILRAWGQSKLLYFAPDTIPEAFRHPYSREKAVTLDNSGLIDGGIRSVGHLAIAEREGGPLNRVLTAVEDFVKNHPKTFCFANIPGALGLGLLFSANHPNANQIAMIVGPFHDNQLMRVLEESRLASYLKVLEYQESEKPVEKEVREKRCTRSVCLHWSASKNVNLKTVA